MSIEPEHKSKLVEKSWRGGELWWKFKKVQRRLYDAFKATQSFLYVSLVARQTGKSYLWVCVAIETCIKKPNARVRYGTAFQKDLEEFIKPIFEQVCEDAPRWIKPKYESKGSKYKFNNGSEIKLVGLDLHPDGLRGNALDLVVIDEAGFVSNLRYVFSIVIAMLRHRPQLRVIMSSTPSETPDHEFTEFVQEAEKEGNLFKATIDDDESCTIETKQRIAKECGGYDSTTYRREFLCEFIVDAELAIVPEWKDVYIQESVRDEFFPYYHRYGSQDLGVVDLTANLFAYYDFKKATLVIEDETHINGPSLTTDKLAEMIKAKEKELWNDLKVYRRISDNNNLLLLNDLGALHGLHFRATDKDELPAMINEVRLLVKQGRLIVHPRCKMLIGCLKYGVYNSTKAKREFARSKVYGHYDHLAALVYLVRNLDTNTNPIPRDYNLNANTHFIPEDLHKSETELQFDKMFPKKIKPPDKFKARRMF